MKIEKKVGSIPKRGSNISGLEGNWIAPWLGGSKMNCVMGW